MTESPPREAAWNLSRFRRLLLLPGTRPSPLPPGFPFCPSCKGLPFLRRWSGSKAIPRLHAALLLVLLAGLALVTAWAAPGHGARRASAQAGCSADLAGAALFSPPSPGEGPGHDEDVQGIPFVGRAGRLLTQIIQAMGLRREDVYICNVIKCRPPENRTPEKDEIATCSPFLLRQLAVIRPKVIVCLGNVAAQTLLGTHKPISHYRGQWFDFRGSRLIATYHTAYLLRNPSAKAEVWADLKKVMGVLGLKPGKR